MPRWLPHFTPATAASRGRYATHALALAAVCGLALVSAFTPAPAAPPVIAATGGGDLDSGDSPPPPDWLVAPAADQQQADGSAQTAASSRSRVAPPAWVLSTQDTPLWSGPDDQALLFTTAPASSYFQPLGPYLGGRLLVFYPGDGAGRAAGQVWVDANALQPSDPPPTPAPNPTPPPAPALKPLVAGPTRISDAPPPRVTAKYIAIVDEASGALMYGDHPYDHVAPASVTKIANTIVALERSPDLSKLITVTVSASAMAARDGSSTMGIEPGEKVKLETLLYGMMLPSGNDAAEQVAVSLGGTRETYVGWMNDKMAQLGLKDSHFVTPSGMDAPGHYSSAYDMAMVARYAMQNPTFRKMAGAMYYQGDGYSMKNANRLIGYYSGADGVKIGYTDEAHKTIVASATRNGHRVYASLFHSEDLVSDGSAMLDWVWDVFRW